MDATNPISTAGSFARLQQFARRRVEVERCEMCSADLSSSHEHLVDIETHRLVCACEACAILFSSQSSLKFRRVPRDVRWLRQFRMTDAQWGGLMIPIEMAFLFRDSRRGKVLAFYPSLAGAVESTLSLEMWSEIERENPEAAEMQPDVEALLVNRVGSQRGVQPEFFVVPIDQCYRLVGLIRRHWRGLSGGTEVWREVGAFFEALKSKAGSPAEAQNA